MAKKMEFGFMLPTFSWPELDLKAVATIKDFARRAEELGFTSVWAPEHFIVAPGLYGTSWLSSLTVLAYVAAVTERVTIGPDILIAPLRNPIILAKELVTLQYLSQGRFALGIGVGWDDHEFTSIGVPLKERGGRTDEMIAALRRLLTERDVSFHGKYYNFDNVTIDPLLDRFPELWVAGGSKIPTSLSPDKPYITEPVLRRILGADAWMARAAGNDEMIRGDIAQIRSYLDSHGRDPASLHYSHVNFFHLARSRDRAEALREQEPKIFRVMGSHRPIEHLQQCYFIGPTDEIIERIAGLGEAGLDSIIIGPLDYEIEQLERFAAEVMPHFKG
jgi:probable F420-dependent oxidoreductase